VGCHFDTQPGPALFLVTTPSPSPSFDDPPPHRVYRGVGRPFARFTFSAHSQQHRVYRCVRDLLVSPPNAKLSILVSPLVSFFRPTPTRSTCSASSIPSIAFNGDWRGSFGPLPTRFHPSFVSSTHTDSFYPAALPPSPPSPSKAIGGAFGPTPIRFHPSLVFSTHTNSFDRQRFRHPLHRLQKRLEAPFGPIPTHFTTSLIFSTHTDSFDPAALPPSPLAFNGDWRGRLDPYRFASPPASFFDPYRLVRPAALPPSPPSPSKTIGGVFLTPTDMFQHRPRFSTHTHSFHPRPARSTPKPTLPPLNRFKSDWRDLLDSYRCV
jgi:hypothetical protein